MSDEMRTFEPIPRRALVLPPAPAHGPVVTPADWADGDRSMARYFWTSTGKDEQAFTCSEDEIRRIINFGMKARPVVHGTPFGHGELTIHVDRVPMPIGEQMTRARVMRHSEDGSPIVDLDWKPNISKKSYRYVTLGGGVRMIQREPYSHADMEHCHELVPDLFYVPEPEHVHGQVGRPGEYEMVPLDAKVAVEAREMLRQVYAEGLAAYTELVAMGMSPEQARFALPQGAYTRLYATESYRNWFNFCLARNDRHAQQEIRWIGEQVEAILAQAAPLTYELWLSHGRRML